MYSKRYIASERQIKHVTFDSTGIFVQVRPVHTLTAATVKYVV